MKYNQLNFGPDYLGIGTWNTGTIWFDHQFQNHPCLKNHEVENQILNSSSSVHNIPQAIKKNIASKHCKHIEKFIEADYLPNGEPIFREWLKNLKNSI